MMMNTLRSISLSYPSSCVRRIFRTSISSCQSFVERVSATSPFALQKRAITYSMAQPSHSSHPLLLSDDEVTPKISRKEYQNRRQKLLDMLPKRSIVLIHARPTQLFAHDIQYYPYRQCPNFYYMTGLMEPNSAIALYKNTEGVQSHLLLFQPTDTEVLWDGPKAGTNLLDAAKYFGVSRCYKNSKDNLERLISGSVQYFVHMDPHSSINVYCDNPDMFQHILSRCKTNSSSNACLQFFNLNCIESLRQCKSTDEIALMREASNATAQGFDRVFALLSTNMPSSSIMNGIDNKRGSGNLTERCVGAAFEYGVRRYGASGVSYPPVIAAGSRACTIHYVRNDGYIYNGIDSNENGKLLLMDAGAEYYGYACDVSRTFPVVDARNVGYASFSNAHRELYEMILEVQLECIGMLEEGVMFSDVHRRSVSKLAAGLNHFRIPPSLISKYFPHTIGHQLGLDVHDVHSVSFYQCVLKSGMIVTIEPGLYFPLHDTEIPKEFRGVGIRIEDNIVIGEGADKSEVLTDHIPKTVQQLEDVFLKYRESNFT